MSANPRPSIGPPELVLHPVECSRCGHVFLTKCRTKHRCDECQSNHNSAAHRKANKARRISVKINAIPL